MSEDNNKYLLQSVDNSLTVIELLCDHEELSLAEMVELTQYSKSSLFRMLVTLEKHKLVDKTENNTFRLGYKLASIGAIVTDRMELVKIAHPYLQDLSAKTNESTHLVIFVTDSKVQFIDKVRGNSSIWMESTIGMTRLAHLTGTGKVLLAFSTEEFIEHYIENTPFEKYTDTTILSGDQLKEELKKIKNDDFGCDREESEEGVVCFAAPIRDFRGKVIAAISASGARDRMYNREQEWIEAVKTTAQAITKAIS